MCNGITKTICCHIIRFTDVSATGKVAQKVIYNLFVIDIFTAKCDSRHW